VTRSSPRVRRAVAGDEPILRKLRLQALTDAPEAFGSTYERELARTPSDWQRWLSPGITFFWGDEEDVYGLVAGARDAMDVSIAYLMSMWVHSSIRGSGAADALVDAVVGWARTEGFQWLRLNVMKDNARALRFYERSGFAFTGVRAVHQHTGQSELQMELRVLPSK
jgi:ribosomal protein S18 acetylase RimI-like enzyme